MSDRFSEERDPGKSTPPEYKINPLGTSYERPSDSGTSDDVKEEVAATPNDPTPDITLQNPFGRPIINLASELHDDLRLHPAHWISLAVKIALLGVFCVLYLTAGVASQVDQVLLREINRFRRKMSDPDLDAASKSSHVFAIGVCFVLKIFPWALVLPFRIIGRLGEELGLDFSEELDYGTITLIITVLAGTAVVGYVLTLVV
jgi:hypothetical protein